MLRRRRKLKEFEPGAPPGEVTDEHVEEHARSQITVYSYDDQNLEKAENVTVEQALGHVDDESVTWINLDGLGDLAVLERLWDAFDVHPLIREDIVNTSQRPKFEEYEGQDFLVLQMVQLIGETLFSEQVSIVFGRNWIVSFQERPGDVFDGVRDRLVKGRPRIRSSGADYLAYSLLDAQIDAFFPILERYGEWMERVERGALDDPTEDTIEDIHELKRDFLTLRRALWPMREATTAMQRTDGSKLITKETRTFLRDAYDHVVRVMDMLETYRELASSLADVYYSTLSHRMNEVMKVLTIVATIFIPLTFIAGLYGMNFNPNAGPLNMPELGWAYGYPATLLVMVVIAAGMVWMFHRRDWL